MELNVPVLPEPEEVPNEPIAAFYITARDRKKAKRVRKMLALDAPAESGEHIKRVPIKVMPRIQKNRMYAITSSGAPVLAINLKSGEIKFCDNLPIA